MRKSSPRWVFREVEAILPFQARPEKNEIWHHGGRALGSVQCVEAGITETVAEVALRPVPSREW